MDGTTDTIFFDNVREAVRYANHHGFTVTESMHFEDGKRERAQTDAEVAAKQAAATKFAVDVDPLTGQDLAVEEAQADTIRQFTDLAKKEGTKEVAEATFRLLAKLGVKVGQKDFKIRANRVVPENPVGLEKLTKQFRDAFTKRLAENRKAADEVFNGLLEKATLEELSALSGSLENGPRKTRVNKELTKRLDDAEAAAEQALLDAAAAEDAPLKRVRKKKDAPEEKATPEQTVIADAHRAALRTKWEPLAVARGRSAKEFNDGFDRAVDLAAARFDVKLPSSKFAAHAGHTIVAEMGIQTLSPKEQVALDTKVRDSYEKLTNQWEAYARGRGQVVSPELSSAIADGIISSHKRFDPALNDNFEGYVSRLMMAKLNRKLTEQEKATSAYAVRLDQKNEDGQDSHGRIAAETNTQLTNDESRRTSLTNLTPDAENAIGAEFGEVDITQVKKLAAKITGEAKASAVAAVKERALKKGSQAAREAAFRHLDEHGIPVTKAEFDLPEGKKFTNKSAAVKAEMEALEEIYDSAYNEHYENTRRKVQTNAGNDPSQSGRTPGRPAADGGKATGRPPVVAPAARGPVARDGAGGSPGTTSPGVGRVSGGKPPQLGDRNSEPGRGEAPAKAAVVDEQFRLKAQDQIEGLLHEQELSPDEADGLTARIATADTNEKIAQVLKDAGVSTIPTFGAFSGHHGTPHTVDEFKLTKIGTGVGSQVYGWGLYFAELARDADAYRKGLTAQLSFGGPAMVPGERFLPEFAGSKVTWGGWRGGDTLTGNVKVLSRRGEPVVSVEVVNGESGKKRWEMDLRHEKQHLTAKLIPTTTGNLYEVSIDAELDALLDWDKPFSEQSEKVRAALSKFDNAEYGGFRASELGKNLYRGIGEIIAKRQGGSVQERGNAAGKLASEWLREAGISGIRYLDEERRNPDTNEPTRNYVIFDEAIIKITARNGSPLSSAERDGVLADLSPVAAGASARAGRTERRFGRLRSKKHLAADGVAYDPQLATVKVGRVAVDARIEQLGAEEKAHVMRLALFLGDRFGEQVRILFDDGAGSAAVDPMIAGHHTILVNPQTLAWQAKDLGKDANLWLKRVGFEEVAHLATFRQIRADLDKSLGHGSTASEFHDHLQERLEAIAGSMTKEQKAWVKTNYGRPLGAQNLASEYLRMLVQVGRQMGGDHGAGLTEAAWMETQTPSSEVRSWLRQMVDAMKKMLRVKPDPQLRPLAVGIDKLLLKMEKAAKKAAKKGTAVEVPAATAADRQLALGDRKGFARAPDAPGGAMPGDRVRSNSASARSRAGGARWGDASATEGE